MRAELEQERLRLRGAVLGVVGGVLPVESGIGLCWGLSALSRIAASVESSCRKLFIAYVGRGAVVSVEGPAHSCFDISKCTTERRTWSGLCQETDLIADVYMILTLYRYLYI